MREAGHALTEVLSDDAKAFLRCDADVERKETAGGPPRHPGVSLGAAFFGESMFALAQDASKVAFAASVERFQAWGFQLIDCQVETEHLARFGAEDWTRKRFRIRGLSWAARPLYRLFRRRFTPLSSEPPMRLGFTGVVSLCVLVTGCATSPKHTALLERREAIREAQAGRDAQFYERYRSDDGFQSTRWGMTVDEVRAQVPNAVASARGNLTAALQVADRPALAHYVFAQGRLAAVTLHFVTRADVRQEHGSLSELLTLKYGKPLSQQDTAFDAEQRLGLQESLNFLARATESYQASKSGVAATPNALDYAATQREARARQAALLAQNDFALVSRWKNTETEIALFGRQSPGHRGVTLHYLSSTLSQRLQQELQAQEQEHKQERAQEL